jgi:acyl-CoA thioester hydrolase
MPPDDQMLPLGRPLAVGQSVRRMANPFLYRLRVRYGECDAQRVVFNARYADYIDIAVLEFLRALGYRDSFIEGPLDYQLVKQTLEWKAPARFDQVLEITVWAKHLGNTSLTIATDFHLAGDDHVILTGETVYVLVEAHALKKTPIPPDLRKALTHGAAGLVIDHADSTARPR